MNIALDQPLFDLAIVLLAGIVGGELVGRLKLPKVTGWIGTGIILRALNLPGLTPGEELDRFLPFMHFVLGYIAFTVGASLHFASLRNSRQRLGLLMLCEATITPAVVFLALRFIGGLDVSVSMLLAAIAIAGAPGTTVLVVQEARARGILTRTLIAGVGLIDMVAVGVFVFVSAILSIDEGGVAGAMAAVGMQFGLTFAIGLACAAIVVLLTRTIVGPAFLGPSIVFVILASWGAAVGCGVSGILACTFAGFCLSNLQHDTIRSAEAYLNQIGGVLFAAFFTFAGMRLDFSAVLPMAGFVALYFFARLCGKYFGAFGAMQLSGATKRVRNYLGLALLPHGGVAVGLILLTQDQFGGETSAIGSAVTTIGLATLAINQLIGPSATKLALQLAGEAGLDRARLLDFLDEHHITVNIAGHTKEEIVTSLANQLYAVSSSMPVSQEEFIRLVMEREGQETSCLGEGLMIPHAVLPGGTEINGILGIHSEGLHLDAPDGRPVHAVLLLATPASDRTRHLEVLAAFASAITHNVSLREQLYHARSPAHAYEILHAEEAQDLNYFLEDAMERAGLRDDNA